MDEGGECIIANTEVIPEQSKIMQPMSVLSISEKSKNDSSMESTMMCMLCDNTFPVTENGVNNPMLAHLLSQHKLVIAEVQNVTHFPKYVRYWKERFKEVSDLTDFCVLINTNTADADKDPQEKFFLLTDFLPEDHNLRDQLTKEKLTKILDNHLRDRSDESFHRPCLFCKDDFKGSRSILFNHMNQEHAFNLGNSDNIVNANEFLDVLQEALDRFQCLFCENTFKDWVTLKDHMRKKGHKRLNPKNKDYDKYYLINYLDPSKNWKDLQHDPEYEREDENMDEDKLQEKEWADWTEPCLPSLCLFCSRCDNDVDKIIAHMRDDHRFDFLKLKKPGATDFYHQIKIVNYIRRQIYLKKCPHCLLQLSNDEELQLHLGNENHCSPPADRQAWDQPEYYFPTYDDDTLLCYLEDDEEAESDNNQNIKK